MQNFLVNIRTHFERPYYYSCKIRSDEIDPDYDDATNIQAHCPLPSGPLAQRVRIRDTGVN